MSTINNTTDYTALLQCTSCDKEIERDSREHDECMLVNKGNDLICTDCLRVCKAKCGECPVCEEEKEEELAGDLCVGASGTVIYYTMAGGGAHWWDYEVHYDDNGQQAKVYRHDINGCRVLFNFQRYTALWRFRISIPCSMYICN